jgi:hypothetical protein
MTRGFPIIRHENVPNNVLFLGAGLGRGAYIPFGLMLDADWCGRSSSPFHQTIEGIIYKSKLYWDQICGTKGHEQK